MASEPQLSTACSSCGERVPGEAAFCSHCGSALTARSDDPLVGKVIAERYLLKQRLGEGSSGTIYLAQHLTLKRRLVVKILHESLTRDDLAVERFRREATMVGEIQDEHIVEVLDFGRTDDGRLFLTMEHLEGETLSARLDRGAMPVDRALEVMKQIGDALVEAHALGYVHRDLRPRNVFLVDRRGHDFVKLLDFGLAKLVEREDGKADQTSLGMTFGDPRYMSPEQSLGRSIDRRSDIYSLGIITFEMLTGRPPFVGAQSELLRQHISVPAPAVSSLRRDVPAWLDAVVACALEKSQDKRFLTVHRMLEEIAAGQATGQVDIARASSEPGAGPAPALTVPPVAPVAPVASPAAGAGAGQANRATAIVRTRVPTESDASMSGKWYADGEELAEGESSQQTSAVRSVYEDWPSEVYGREQKRTWLWVLIAMGVLGAVIAGWLMSSRKGTDAAAVVDDVDAAAVTPPVVTEPAVPAPTTAPAPAPAPAPAEPATPAPTVTAKTPPVSPAPKPKAVVDGPLSEPVRDPRERAPVREPVAEQPAPTTPSEPAPDPDSPAGQAGFYVKLGQSALAQGDVSAARDHFTKARELDTGNAMALAGFGQIAMAQQHYEEALVHLEAAARLEPRSERVWLLIGEAHLGMGKPTKARKAFLRALRINPRSEPARRGVTRSSGG